MSCIRMGFILKEKEMNKYKTIIQDILSGIEKGDFKRGQKLPSIRKLSEKYQCSKDTVQKAMLELKYQNAIYAVEKSGYYILEDKDFQEEMLDLNPADFQQLPYEDFRICLNESLVGRENYLFNYYHQQEGLEDLIASSHQLLMDYDVYCRRDQLVITAGTQQALYILSKMDFGSKGKKILLESPTYDRMQALVEKQNLPFVSIERTFAGLDLAELERIFKTGQIAFFYTIPRLHNPLGTSYTLEEKKEIVRLAQTYQVYIVEDDYLADFDSSRTVPFHYLDTENRVIYLKSFTTTLFPALRIGCVVLPPKLVQAFLEEKSLIDYDTNLIMQKALSLYIDNGMFARNTQHLKDLHFQQVDEMKNLLESADLACPYQISREKLILALQPAQLTASLKHSSIPLELVETDNQVYLILAYGEKLEGQLNHIKEYMEK